MSGFVDLINRIKYIYKTGLVTASPIHTLQFINKKLNLEYYFDKILSGDETENNKPFPDPYIIMMNRLSVNPKNCIIIEDSKQGLKSAVSSGAHVIGITGSIPKIELKIADKIIEHLDEITLDLLEKLLHNY